MYLASVCRIVGSPARCRMSTRQNRDIRLNSVGGQAFVDRLVDRISRSTGTQISPFVFVGRRWHCVHAFLSPAAPLPGTKDLIATTLRSTDVPRLSVCFSPARNRHRPSRSFAFRAGAFNRPVNPPAYTVNSPAGR